MREIKLLNHFHIKLFAILFMTIDHIGVIFDMPIIFRILGRISFPLFAFVLYQGYMHTRNRIHYFLRVFLFGVLIELGLILINQFFYVPMISRNIFLLLGFGILGLILLDMKLFILTKAFLIFLLGYLATVLQFDYYWYGFVFILTFRFYPNYFYISIILQFFLAFLNSYYTYWDYQYYTIIAWIFILMYNHQKGASFKYLFYIYYPLHLIVLYLIAMLFYY